MQQHHVLHKYLCKKSTLYARWHKHPRHTFHHFVVFSAVCFGTTAVLLSTIYTVDLTGGVLNIVPPRIVYAEESMDTNELTDQLIKNFDGYSRSGTFERSGKLKGLQRTASYRRSSLEGQIRNDPEEALLNVLPEDVLNALPDNVESTQEKYVEIEGTVSEMTIDNPETGTSSKRYKLRQKNNSQVDVFFTDEDQNFSPIEKINFEGILVGKSFLATEADGTSLVTNAPAYAPNATYTASPWATGNKRILIIMISPSDNAAVPYTATQVEAIAFSNPNSVAAHYNESSFGRLQITGVDVYPTWVESTYTSAQICGGLDETAARDSDAVAAASGYTLSNYQVILHVIPSIGCPYGGWAYYGPYIGGYGYGMVVAYGATSFQQVIEHELGHVFGGDHAATMSCGNQAIGGTCTTSNYGDRHDPLGFYNYFHFNTAHKTGFNWYNASNVQTISSNGTYTLSPIETLTSNVQAFRIYKADSSQYYYVEYRQPVGMDASLPAGLTRGATIYVYDDAWYSLTRKIDTSPGDGDFTNAALTDGGSFIDNTNGITITQTSHSASGAILSISFASGSCTRNIPTLTMSPASQSASTSGLGLSYTLAVVNTDSSACGSSVFTLGSTMPSGWTGTFSVPNLTIAPGSSGSVTLTSLSAVSATAGSYSVTGSVSNVVSGLHSNSAAATHIITAAPASCSATTPTVALSPSSQSALSAIGLSYTLTVTNRDNTACTPSVFTLGRTMPSGWTGTLSVPTLTIAAGASATANLTSLSPLSTTPTSYTISASVSDVATSSHTASASATHVVAAPPAACVRAQPTVTFLPASQSTLANAGLTYTLSVTNADSSTCSATTFGLNRTMPSGWTGTLSVPTLVLSPGASGSATLTSLSLVSSTPGSYSITGAVTDIASSTHTRSFSATHVVNPAAVVSCSASAPTVSLSPSTESALAGVPLTYTLSVTNNDNSSCSASTFSLSPSVPSGWTGTFPVPTLVIAPGSSATAVLTSLSSASANADSFPVTVNISDVATSSHTRSSSATHIVTAAPVVVAPPPVTRSGGGGGGGGGKKKPTTASSTTANKAVSTTQKRTATTLSNLNVRSVPSASGVPLGIQKAGITGTVLEGPKLVGSTLWWKVDYPTGVDGWSISTYLSIKSSTASTAKSTTVSPSSLPKLAIGSLIKTTSNLNVRSNALSTAKLLGIQKIGALGVITDGPFVSGSYTWWKVNYTTGVDGWSVSTYIVPR